MNPKTTTTDAAWDVDCGCQLPIIEAGISISEICCESCGGCFIFSLIAILYNLKFRVIMQLLLKCTVIVDIPASEDEMFDVIPVL